MKFLATLLLVLFCWSCQQDSDSQNIEQASGGDETPGLPDHFYHLDQALEYKNKAAEIYWPAYATKDIFCPIAYFTHEGTFVIDPNQHILENFSFTRLKDSFRGLEIIQLDSSFTDTTGFNFYNSYGEDPAELCYKQNILYCMSFDLTRKFITEMTDLQDWSIMVIHELFHGFQKAIPQFKAHSPEVEIPGGPDRFLGKRHANNEWFKSSVNAENELLKSIWLDSADVSGTLREYMKMRDQRLSRSKAEFGVDLREAEDYEILLEGHARYFEQLAKKYASVNPVDTNLVRPKDRKYFTGIFEGYEPKADQGLFNLYNDRYYYVLGYNISMILEKYHKGWKESIYKTEFNFNSYLADLISG